MIVKRKKKKSHTVWITYLIQSVIKTVPADYITFIAYCYIHIAYSLLFCDAYVTLLCLFRQQREEGPEVCVCGVCVAQEGGVTHLWIYTCADRENEKDSQAGGEETEEKR